MTEAVTVSTQFLPSRVRPARPAAGGAQTRLPWWAAALPALGFAGLLMLLATPAQAESSATEPAARLLGLLLHFL